MILGYGVSVASQQVQLMDRPFAHGEADGESRGGKGVLLGLHEGKEVPENGSK
jgi:hypothetical protein